MIEHVCTISHDPSKGKYGDCFRATVASLLDIENIEHVPHWLDPMRYNSDEWRMWFREWCPTQGCAPVFIGISGDEPIESVFEYMSGLNCLAYYILVGDTASGTHCAIYRADKMVHDTAWFHTPIIKPPAGGDWEIIVLARI